MGKKILISLGDRFENFVNIRIARGTYKNVGEVIRTGLRLLEQEEIHIQRLKDAIQDGLDSKVAVDFDPAGHLESLKNARKANCWLLPDQQSRMNLKSRLYD